MFESQIYSKNNKKNIGNSSVVVEMLRIHKSTKLEDFLDVYKQYGIFDIKIWI